MGRNNQDNGSTMMVAKMIVCVLLAWGCILGSYAAWVITQKMWCPVILVVLTTVIVIKVLSLE